MKIKCILISLLSITLITTAAGFAAEKKSSVAVLDFESVGAEEHLGRAVAEVIRTELIDTRKFRVVERSQISKALTEQRFQQSGVIDEKSATAIGKLLGADMIIIGSVVRMGSSYTINSRMIDVKTGEATLGKSVTGNDLNQLPAMSRSLLDKLFGTGGTRVDYSAAPSPPPAVQQPAAQSRSPSRFAVVNWGNGKAYFFLGGRYIRYDIHSGSADPGYPKPINAKTWPGFIWTDSIDAAVNWGNGKAYFFRDGQYLRYDIAADRVDSGYPQPINNETWPGLIWTDGIDAVINWGNGKAYFFRGGQYIRYDIAADRADPGYPKPVNSRTWPGFIWTDGIDDAVLWSDNKAFFFKGDQFIQYDVTTDRVDPGYPKPVDSRTWPGLQW
jgi:TolB-like protein